MGKISDYLIDLSDKDFMNYGQNHVISIKPSFKTFFKYQNAKGNFILMLNDKQVRKNDFILVCTIIKAKDENIVFNEMVLKCKPKTILNLVTPI